LSIGRLALLGPRLWSVDVSVENQRLGQSKEACGVLGTATSRRD
jgi:hypothetical protein